MVALKTSAPLNLNTPQQMLQQGETVEKDELHPRQISEDDAHPGEISEDDGHHREISEEDGHPGEISEGDGHPGEISEEDRHPGEISEYELCREERIRENRERMQKLGIFHLSQKLTALKPTTKRVYRRKTLRVDSPLLPSPPAPVRRSSRLQSSTPVSYCELKVEKNDKLSKESIILREEGSRPEVYTEEHEKLLGSTEMSWTLFVDGYGKDGKRIYDPIKGKTCHQCRQKTLGHRTHCSQCNMVQGQFCGDCLYMRYGEHVLEAKANPNWICPVCRGICNCSLCRQAKGWPPTGTLYKKTTSLGYKSVAHYLIQTRRAKTEPENNAGSKVPVSAKRSLPFSDIEVTKEDDYPSKPSSEDLIHDPLSVSGKESDDAALTKNETEFLFKSKQEKDSAGCEKEKEASLLASSELDKSSVTVIETKTAKPLHDEGILEANKTKNENFVDAVAAETSPKSTKKRVRCEPTPDSIAGRLRMRRNKPKLSEELQMVNANHTIGMAKVESIVSRLRKRA